MTIDLDKIHEGFRGTEFVYAPMLKLRVPGDLRHCIGYRRRGKITLIGDDNGSFTYPSYEAAADDVKRLNEWSSQRPTQARDQST